MADEKTFSWVHLSNLDISFQDDRAYSKQFASLFQDAQSLGAFDICFVTGDVSQDVNVYLNFDKNSSQLSLPIPFMFIPGDQDSFDTGDIRALLLRHISTDEKVRSVFEEPESYLRNLVWDSFRAYQDFAKIFNFTVAANINDSVFDAYLSSEWLPGDCSGCVQVGDKRIGIVGLNSAYSSMREDAENVLLSEQLKRVCPIGSDFWEKKLDLTLLLTHHPKEKLHPKNQKEFREDILEAGDFTLHLCGSAEPDTAPQLTFIRTQFKDVLSIQAPRFSDKQAGYVFGSLKWIDRDEIEVTITPRVYSEESEGYVDAPYWQEQRTIRLNTKRATLPSFPYIQSISITNFRCVSKMELEANQTSPLGGKWLCLAGINGAGKTSVLQAIALTLFGQEQINEIGDTRLREMIASGYTSFEAELRLMENTQKQRLPIRYPQARQAENEDMVSYQRVWNTLKNLVVVAYGATRNISVRRDTRYDDYSQQLRQIITLFDPLSQIASADVFLQDTTEYGDIFRPLFRNLIQQLFEGDFEVDLEGNRLRFKVEGNLVAAHDLPDGFRSSIAWLADICYLWCQKFPERAQSGKTEDIEAIVLIDEIDLHLHPSLQRTLVPRLRSALPKVQWIVTTHSPLILSCFDKTEIVALDRTAEGGIRKLDRQIMGFSMDQIYEWLMGTKPSSAAMELELERLEETGEEGSEELIKALTHSPTVGEKEAEEARIRRQNLLKRIMQ